MNIRVANPFMLQSYGADVVTEAKEYLAQIEKIYRILDDLSATWTGTKSQNFKQKMDDCRKEFTDFGANLENFGELIKATGAAYIQIESE